MKLQDMRRMAIQLLMQNREMSNRFILKPKFAEHQKRSDTKYDDSRIFYHLHYVTTPRMNTFDGRKIKLYNTL